VAAEIEKQLALDTEIVEGKRGEFTVWVGERCVAKKDHDGFPEDAAIVDAVRQAMSSVTQGSGASKGQGPLE
jgi:hypothetical protein